MALRISTRVGAVERASVELGLSARVPSRISSRACDADITREQDSNAVEAPSRHGELQHELAMLKKPESNVVEAL